MKLSMYFMFKMKTTAESTASKNLSALQADVDETANILKVTVDKLLERDEKLNLLNDQASELKANSIHSYQSSRRIQKKMKWMNNKLTVGISEFSIL